PWPHWPTTSPGCTLWAQPKTKPPLPVETTSKQDRRGKKDKRRSHADTEAHLFGDLCGTTKADTAREKESAGVAVTAKSCPDTKPKNIPRTNF
ncbi:MAG TPA: hypothetical protein VHX11_10965, partial [Acidobacteriaceae bacterium]|nr:hypothetical protein [Acidobacteriaceae bacterium]